MSKIRVDLSHLGYPELTMTMSKKNHSFLYGYKIGSRAGKCKKNIGLTPGVHDLSHPGYPGLIMTMPKEDHLQFIYMY